MYFFFSFILMCFFGQNCIWQKVLQLGQTMVEAALAIYQLVSDMWNMKGCLVVTIVTCRMACRQFIIFYHDLSFQPFSIVQHSLLGHGGCDQREGSNYIHIERSHFISFILERERAFPKQLKKYSQPLHSHLFISHILREIFIILSPFTIFIVL